jgi:hypothetical protein
MPTCKRCAGPVPRRDRVYCDDCLPHYQREQCQEAFRGSGLAAIERRKADGSDPTHSANAAGRRAATNVTRNREAREWTNSTASSSTSPPFGATSSRSFRACRLASCSGRLGSRFAMYP